MRTLQGTITSNRMVKTVVVRVDRLKRHAKYRTYYRVSQKLKADVPDAAAYRVGDIVRVVETRPLSKGKRWRVTELVRRQDALAAEADAPSVLHANV